MEFVDVLSSIRRLVSEHRRADDADGGADAPAPSGPDEAVADEAGAEAPEMAVRLPQESRLVLTAAQRVGPPDAESDAAWTDAGDETGTVPADGQGDMAQDSATPEPADVLMLRPEPSVHAGNQGDGSLEETIAELEAAVAVIEGEFEPDLGDPDIAEPVIDGDGAMPDAADADGAIPSGAGHAGDDLPVWSAPAATTPGDGEAAADGATGFRGIMAGFDGLSAADDRLDLPVIGDVSMPIIPRGDSWRVNLSERRAEEAQVAAPGGAGDAAVPAQSDAPECRGLEERAAEAARWVAGTGDSPVSAAEPEPEPEAEAVAGALDGSPAAADLPAVDSPAGPMEPVPSDFGGEGPEGATGESATPAAPEADEEADEERPREASRPVIIRAGDEVADQSRDGDDAGSAAPEPAADRDGDMADLLSTDGLHEADTADGPDLFDPGEDGFDRALLHDMVAEIIREELRGPLGERITRNVRLLIRREIERALGRPQ